MDEESVKKLFMSGRCIDDDVAFERVGGLYVLTSIDTFVASTDKPLLMDWRSVGYKAVVATLSDLMVKGGEPFTIMISLGLSRLSRYELSELSAGIHYALRRYGLAGCLKWDTNRSRDPFVSVGGVAISRCKPPVRSGARPGDYVYVDGYFGLTWLGLNILLGKYGVEELDHSLYHEAVKQFEYPSPNLHLYPSIVKRTRPNATIDSSDGLAASLYQVARASGVDIIIEDLPVHPLLRRLDREAVLEATLYGGEEYRGVFFLSGNGAAEAERLGLIRIGRVVEGGGRVYLGDGSKVPEKGFRHVF